MSQRGKRPNRLDMDDGPTAPPSKRRKGRPPAKVAAVHSSTTNVGGPSDAAGDEGGDASGGGASSWQPRNDIKSSIYNRSAPEAPAELFRKDLISAMKLPDSEPLAQDEYWTISDQWKQEWERGVQVPVNPDSLPEPSVSAKLHDSFYTGRQDFKLPKNKFIRITKDDNFSSELHYLSNTPAMADAACAYDLDQTDEAWLKILNGERAMTGHPVVTEEQFERVVEELEARCWEKIQSIMKSEEGLGIEYDENVICDVCRSPDSEEANEMVFCDSCNICVHQACYGITAIPSGSWLCRTCSMGKRPDCVLCPNKGGAMKSTRSGQKWAHVSCALWIPEVSIGSVDRMEPITKISSIPQSRWALICVLCRERVGACIQCSVKTCKTAYHVTCAFQHGLEMRAIIEDELAEDGVKLRSYCLKHSMNKNKKDKNCGTSNNNGGSGSDEDDHKRKKHRKDMTSEERNIARMKRLSEVEAEFDKHVTVRDVIVHLFEVDQEGIQCIYNYWILKRKAQHNRSLLPQKQEDVDMIAQKQEPADIEKMKMFVHLRQDLERVRNLCYMVSRREKLSRSFFKMREQTFHKQVAVLSEDHGVLDDKTISAIMQANHGPSVYDRLYSSEKCLNLVGHVGGSLEQVLGRLLGKDGHSATKHTPKAATNKKHSTADLNGLPDKVKKSRSRLLSQSSDNISPSKNKSYINGATTTPVTTRMSSIYGSSLSSDSDDTSSPKRTSKGRHSSSNDDDTEDERLKSKATVVPSSSIPITPTSANKKKLSAGQRSMLATSGKSGTESKIDRRKQRRTSMATGARGTKLNLDSSSDEDAVTGRNSSPDKRSPRKGLLRQMELELEMAKYKVSGTESDELIPIRNMSGQKISSVDVKKLSSSAIYSDSDSTDKDKTDHTASDSQQHQIRTKAAMKEFNMHSAGKTEANKVPLRGDEVAKKTTAEHAKNHISNVKDNAEKEQINRDRELAERLQKQSDKAEEEKEAGKLAEEKENQERTKREKEQLDEKERLKTEKIEAEKKQKAEKRITKEKADCDRISLDATPDQSKEKTSPVKVRPCDKPLNKSSRGFAATDLQVVPQRKAAKKASENMMRTTVPVKKDAKEQRDEDQPRDSPPSRVTKKDSGADFSDRNDSTTVRSVPLPASSKESPPTTKSDTTPVIKPGRGRPSNSSKTAQAAAAAAAAAVVVSSQPKSSNHTPPTKELLIEPRATDSANSNKDKSNLSSSKDKSEKELIVSYVPQRQAAKKAAEHIKSGLGKPAPEVVATANTSNSSDEKNKPAKKDDKKSTSVVISSGSSGSDSSSNSSSSSSSSSSSESEEDDEKKPESSGVKNDKVKELPFLNKGSKSSRSVSSTGSSSSDSESSGSSDASSDEPKTISKPPVKQPNSRSTKKTPVKLPPVVSPRKPRKEPEKKLKTSELERTGDSTTAPTGSSNKDTLSSYSSSSSSSKGEEPSNKQPALESPDKIVRPAGRTAGKRQSISLDRRRSADTRSGNLNKAIKPESTKTTASTDVTSSKETDTKTTSSAITSPKTDKDLSTLSSPKRTPHGDGARKRKSSVLEDSSKPSVETSNAEPLLSAAQEDTKESLEPSQLPSSKRQTDEKLNTDGLARPWESHDSTDLTSVGSLEKEINERKASSITRSTKSSGSLDKLLSKRERDVLKATQQSPVKDIVVAEETKIEFTDLPKAEVDTKEDVSKITIPNENVIEIIDIDDDSKDAKPHDNLKPATEMEISIQSIPDSAPLVEKMEEPAEPQPPAVNKVEIDLNSSNKSDANNSFTFSDDGKADSSFKMSSVEIPISATMSTSQTESSDMQNVIFPPPPASAANEKNDNSIFNFDNDFATDDPFMIGGTPTDVSGPISFTFPTDNLFKQDFKEDSAKETMDLVGKLRQKFKKSGVNESSRNEPQIIDLDSSPEESLDTTTEKSDTTSTVATTKEVEPSVAVQPSLVSESIINLVDQEDSSSTEKPKSDDNVQAVPTLNVINQWNNPEIMIAPPQSQPETMQSPMMDINQQHHNQNPNDPHLSLNQTNNMLTSPQSHHHHQQQQLQPHQDHTLPVYTEEQLATNLMNLQDRDHEFLRQIHDQSKPDQNIEQITALLHKKLMQTEETQQQIPGHHLQLPNIAIRHHDSADENDHSPRMRPANKWTDNDMIQTRRSVSSSPSSASESNVDDHIELQRQQQQQHFELQQQQQFQQYQSLHMQQQHHLHQHQFQHHMQHQQQQQQSTQHDIRSDHIRKMNDIAFTNMHSDMQSFAVPPQQQQQQQSSLTDQMNHPFNFTNDHSSSFAQGPVSLFPPTSHNVQLPFPSPGAAMFPPNFGNQSFGAQIQPNTTTTATTTINHNSLQHQQPHHLSHDQQQQPIHHQSPLVSTKMDSMQLSYPSNPCGAAFTSSSHNMALTEAIVAPQSSMLNANNVQHSLDNNNLNNTQVQHHSIHHQSTPTDNHIPQGMTNNNNSTDDRRRDSCFHSATVNSQHQASSEHNRISNLPPIDSKMPSLDSDITAQSPPTKTNKRSTRIVAQQAAHNITQQLANRSPSKSPESKSPDSLRHASGLSGRGRGESTRGRKNAPRGTGVRGRPRGRGRGRGGATPVVSNMVPHIPMSHMSHLHPHLHPNIQPGLSEFDNYRHGTNHNKLVGTVYDFNEDFTGENVENLKAMRDRRRSVDCRQDQFRGSRDASQSPKFASPNAHHKSSRMPFNSSDIRDLRPPTPVRRDSLGGANSSNTPSQQHITSPVSTSLHSIVSPVLPGPVDMRTYNSYDNDVYNNSLLGAFATGTADQTLQPIDEEMEKALQSALKASNTKQNSVVVSSLINVDALVVPPNDPNLEDPNVLLQNTSVPINTVPHPIEVPTDDVSVDSADTYPQSKLSLIKLKIKGPHAHPNNYASASVVQPNHIEVAPSHIDVPSIVHAIPPSIRRMRKKELLRQYWNQDMANTDMDNTGVVAGTEFSEPVPHNQTASRSSGGIPKAVDSMSSIPTKDDYKDYNNEYATKKRKTMPRELRLLDIPFDADSITERRRSVGSNASSNSTNASADVTKRMTRTKQQAATMATPKLKIKIGVNATDAIITSDRPPKKRLANMGVPSLEDLKRESMNFRKQVMGEFDEAEEKVKVKKSKSSKSERKEEKREEKRKRKMERKMMKVISKNQDTDTFAPGSDAFPSKLIIRFGKRKADDDSQSTGISIAGASGTSSTNTSPTSAEIVPIRLKIARGSHGSSYVSMGDNDTASKKLRLDSEDTTNRQRPCDGPLDPAQPWLNPTVVVSDVMDTLVSDMRQSTTAASAGHDSGTNRTDPANNNLHPNVPPILGTAAADGKSLVDPFTTSVASTASLAAGNVIGNMSKSFTENTATTSTSQQHQTPPSDQDASSRKGCPPLPLSKDCEVR